MLNRSSQNFIQIHLYVISVPAIAIPAAFACVTSLVLPFSSYRPIPHCVLCCPQLISPSIHSSSVLCSLSSVCLSRFPGCLCATDFKGINTQARKKKKKKRNSKLTQPEPQKKKREAARYLIFLVAPWSPPKYFANKMPTKERKQKSLQRMLLARAMQ